MKRFISIVLLLLLLFPLFAEAKYLRFSLVQSGEHPHAKASEYFARMVTRATNGEINIKLYTSSLTGSASKNIEQLEFGGIQLALVDLEAVAKSIPEIKEIVDRYNFSSREEAYQDFLDNKAQVEEILKENGITLLSVFYPKLNCFYSPLKKVGSEEVIKHLIIGVGEDSYYSSFLNSYGLETKVVAEKDMIMALNNLYIDAAFGPFIDFCLSNRYAFTKNLSITETGALPSLLVINSKVLSLLKGEERELLKEAANKASFYADSLLKRSEESWISRAQGEKEFAALEIEK